MNNKCPSFYAAMRVIGNEERQVTDGYLNNCAASSHLAFRRCKRAMSRFRRLQSLQGFAADHSSVHDPRFIDCSLAG